MRRSRNQNALLVEIMIAVLFFALCSTVILETFVTAREYSRNAGILNEALVEMQDLAERLSAADEAAELLQADGFQLQGDIWQLESEDYRMEVELNVEAAPAGELRTAQIRALCRDKIVAELPWARYLPGEVPA